MRPDEYARHDALGLASLVRTNQVTPTELAEAARQAGALVEGAINAVVEWYEDPHLEPSGQQATLAGVPTLRKDYGATEAGRLVEMGSRLTEGLVADDTSELMLRFRRAGCQVLGRSAVPEMVFYGTTESRLHGLTANPWNPELSAGGSSGGAAAAVAAGVVPLAHAGDCAGSIRIPASACGLIGLKPSRGRVPWGQGGMVAYGGLAQEFVVTRTVRDTAAALDALAGPLPAADSLLPAPPAGYLASLETPPSRLRIAFSAGHWAGYPPDPKVVEVVTATAAALEALGHQVGEVAPPVEHEWLASTWDALYGRWVARDVRHFAGCTGRPPDHEHLEPMTLAQVERVGRLAADDVSRAEVTAGDIRAHLARRLAGFDAVLCSSLGRARLPLRHLGGELADVEEFNRRNDEHFPHSYLFNLAGWPVISVPGGFAADGLPVGVDLAAPVGKEETLLGLARQLEQARPWHGRHPRVWAGHRPAP